MCCIADAGVARWSVLTHVCIDAEPEMTAVNHGANSSAKSRNRNVRRMGKIILRRTSAVNGAIVDTLD